ncbi:MAG: cysteine hydrolase [Leptospirales bacterium]|nr:cysteine hydrolase [Leptospirales bacterium]
MEKIALAIVDMQKYYLESNSDYSRYFEHIYPGSLSYIRECSYNTVIPNILKLKNCFKSLNLPVIYLRLCSKEPDRSDLHRFFKRTYEEGVSKGFAGVYPIETDIAADIIDELKPDHEDIIINKTTFSPFSSSDIEAVLKSLNVKVLVFTGLATSQCVETSARDASDRGFDVFHIHDAQTDYSEIEHNASLYSSRAVCGGAVYDTDSFIQWLNESI